MWPISYNSNQTINNIISDVACFANKNSLETVKRSEYVFEINWKERQLLKKAEFQIKSHEIYVKYDGIKNTYREFLSSSYMANLSHAGQQFLAL